MRREIVALVVAALLTGLSAAPPAALADQHKTWEELQKERQSLEKAAGQTQRDEQAAVAELFNLNRTLEEIRAVVARLDGEVATVTRQRAEAEAERGRLEGQRQEKQAQFGRRARYYAENGTFAPVGFVIGARSFGDFLVRVDIISQVLKRDARLMRELRELKAAVETHDRLLAEKQAELRGLREKQAAEQARLQTEVARRERLLAELRELRGAIETRVSELEQVWATSARPVLDAFGKRLQTVALKVTDLEPDEINITLIPPGATVKVKEKSLNEFIQKDSDLKGLSVRVIPGHVNLEGTYKGISVQVVGRFAIKGSALIRYEPKEIRFQGFVLPQSVTDDLLAAGRLDIDFSRLLGPWGVKEILTEEGMLTVRGGLK